MVGEAQQILILKHLGITRWHVKSAGQHEVRSTVQEALSVDKIGVILSSLAQKDHVLPLIQAMFSRCSVCCVEKDVAKTEKNIASSTIILYDENLTLQTCLDESLHARCFAVNLDKLNRAAVKKQTMMNLYAVSDFATR